MSAVRLSAVLITRNEAPRIEASLAALRFCDEVVVVDSESTDGTPALATAAGARVVTRPWYCDGATSPTSATTPTPRRPASGASRSTRTRR